MTISFEKKKAIFFLLYSESNYFSLTTILFYLVKPQMHLIALVNAFIIYA